MTASGERQDGVGAFIRSQREIANMSLRQLARMSNVSNAYLSQIERGLHEPSLRVLSAVSDALSMRMEDLLAGRSKAASERSAPPATQDLAAAIQAEPQLTSAQKAALLAVYRGFLQTGPHPDGAMRSSARGTDP